MKVNYLLCFIQENMQEVKFYNSLWSIALKLKTCLYNHYFDFFPVNTVKLNSLAELAKSSTCNPINQHIRPKRCLFLSLNSKVLDSIGPIRVLASCLFSLTCSSWSQFRTWTWGRSWANHSIMKVSAFFRFAKIYTLEPVQC